jgi:hypothetical protein
MNNKIGTLFKSIRENAIVRQCVSFDFFRLYRVRIQKPRDNPTTSEFTAATPSL